MTLPFVGRVPLDTEQVAFFAGVGALAVIGVLEWPVAAALGAGHLLMHRRANGVLREFGEALDEA